MDLLEELKNKWFNIDELELYLLDLVAKQLQIAEDIAAQEMSLNNAFISEREDMFKGTDSMAKAKAKSLVNYQGSKLEYEFSAINNLISIIIERISRLQALQPGGPVVL